MACASGEKHTAKTNGIKRILFSRYDLVAKAQFDIIYKRVPGSLREVREAAGLTQREFARRVGKTQSWVYKSEAGLRRIDIAEFLHWCKGCDLEPLDATRRLLKIL